MFGILAVIAIGLAFGISEAIKQSEARDKWAEFKQDEIQPNVNIPEFGPIPKVLDGDRITTGF
jgi:hypothetical protein